MLFKNFLLKNCEKVIIIIFLLYLYQLPLNSYSIYLHNYNIRLLNNYGYCEKESYGYLKRINQNNNNKNIHSYNFEDFPKSSSVFFFNLKNNFDNKKIILLNYYSKNPKEDVKIIEIFGKYKILDNYQNKCFLIETTETIDSVVKWSGKIHN